MPRPAPEPPSPTRTTPAYPTRQTVDYRPGKRTHHVKRHHAYTGCIIIIAWILPPLAVAARFGIGVDFFINLVLTCCGYIPGHIHYFLLLNLRNNRTKNRSPAWAVRAGLVKDYRKSQAKKRNWAGRYDDDGVRVGGDSHYDRQRWEQQDVIVDPVTDEVAHDAPPRGAHSGSESRASGQGKRLPSPAPWEQDSTTPSPRAWDNGLLDPARASVRSPHSPPEDGHDGGGEEKAAAIAQDSAVRPTGTGRRDSVTGALIDEDDLSPSGSSGHRDIPSSSFASSSTSSVHEKPHYRRSSRKAARKHQLAPEQQESQGVTRSPVVSHTINNDAPTTSLSNNHYAAYMPNDGLNHEF